MGISEVAARWRQRKIRLRCGVSLLALCFGFSPAPRLAPKLPGSCLSRSGAPPSVRRLLSRRDLHHLLRLAREEVWQLLDLPDLVQQTAVRSRSSTSEGVGGRGVARAPARTRFGWARPQMVFLPPTRQEVQRAQQVVSVAVQPR